MSCRILIVVNTEWYFLSHWLPLARALRDEGKRVTVAAAVERGKRQAIEEAGLRFLPLNLERRSTRPLQELASLWQLVRLYRRERPDLVHHVTIKPVLYGSLAARIAAVAAVINTIPGLGSLFLKTGFGGEVLRRLGYAAYRLALSGDRVRVTVQNPEDLETFVSKRIVPARRVTLIRGSGVDVDEFEPSAEPAGPPIVLLAGRLIWDKGVGELADASRRLQKQGVACRVVLAGIPDPKNPSSIPEETLNRWRAEGLLEWWGLRHDMAAVLQQTSIVVLPSYREGLPRILLEAAAAGRPIVATDVPGCREVVRHGVNGLLVPAHDASALAEAIRTLLQDAPLRARMGLRGREIVVAEFSQEQVLEETLAVYRELLREFRQHSS